MGQNKVPQQIVSFAYSVARTEFTLSISPTEDAMRVFRETIFEYLQNELSFYLNFAKSEEEMLAYAGAAGVSASNSVVREIRSTEKSPIIEHPEMLNLN